jgi:LPXTG-motif cell wall-anchored protein
MERNRISKGFRSIAGIGLAVLMLVGMALQAAAEVQVIDTERTDCSIVLSLTYKDGSAVKNMTGGKLSIYKVAGVTSGDKGYVYDVSEGSFSSAAELSGLSSMTQKQLDAKNASLAESLSGKTSGASAAGTASVKDGLAEFTGLSAGLYLVVQSVKSDGEREINPFLISIPDSEGNYAVSAAPKNGVISPEPPTQPTTEPPKPPVLPQTGQLWWPVAVMGGLGALFLLFGALRRRRMY